MVDVVSQVGGHFGGGLGAVELTVALHKVFNTMQRAGGRENVLDQTFLYFL